MPFLISDDYVPGRVRGTIFKDNDFKIEIRFLHEDTVERLRNIFFMVVGGKNYAYFHVNVNVNYSRHPELGSCPDSF
jgi:hypothetical protein